MEQRILEKNIRTEAPAREMHLKGSRRRNKTGSDCLIASVEESYRNINEEKKGSDDIENDERRNDRYGKATH